MLCNRNLFVVVGSIIYLSMSSMTVYGHEHLSCAPLASNMVSWNKPVSIRSAQNISNIQHATIQVGQTINATLFPTRSVQFPVPTEERGGSVSFAGSLQFNITKKSTYRIITDGRPWIEMVQNDKTIPSIKHQHGEKCWGMEKVIDFSLTPGRHILELTGNGKENIKFIVIPVAE
ncbi:hypothetical protein [Commensalibacter oyaizuii]|uniref:Homogentisate 1,2-dioxygenase n=1 Tax=Commensalibacter oyaizuii TaxID=3043873 RepID=A0ABT6Q2F0_9PROT|nr:hypothetical protein [Commensalibacter sp. TBRC 16381]MDI2091311.1 hypothetical protein [Commensalibacter sp. TBRC 16381]